MVKRIVALASMVVVLTSFTGCGLFSASDDSTQTSAVYEDSNFINNAGVSFSYNRLVCSEKYIYQTDGNKLYRYEKDNVSNDSDSSDDSKKSNTKKSKTTPEPRKEIASVDSGREILCPVLFSNKIYYLDYKDKKADLIQLDSDGTVTTVMENIEGVNRLYSSGNNLFLTVSQDSTNFDLVKVNTSDNTSTILMQNVVPNYMYVDKSQVYYLTKQSGKVYLNCVGGGVTSQLCEMPESAFIVEGNFVYYLDDYSYVDTNWKNSVDYVEKKIEKTEQPKATDVATDESTGQAKPETVVKEEPKPVESTGKVVLKKMSLLNTSNIETVFDLAPIGAITGCDGNVYFSHLKDGKFRGIIKFESNNRQVDLPYSQEKEITSMCASNDELFFTVKDDTTVYSITDTNDKVKEYN